MAANYPMKFQVDNTLRFVDDSKRLAIRLALENSNQQHILQVLNQNDEEVNSRLYSDLLDVDFELMCEYFKQYQIKKNLISDASTIRTLPTTVITVKSQLPKLEVDAISEIGWRTISQGKGMFTSRCSLYGRR
jgi:hypothetical protein